MYNEIFRLKKKNWIWKENVEVYCQFEYYATYSQNIKNENFVYQFEYYATESQNIKNEILYTGTCMNILKKRIFY